MQFKRLISLIICFVLAGMGAVVSQENRFSLQGEISFRGKGTIYVILVSAETFKKPAQGPYKVKKTLTQKELASGKFYFEFSDIEAGEYGIKCYIDENGNGEMDTNFLGIPDEPWGMSWNDGKPFGEPDFTDMSFNLDKKRLIKMIVD